ncbi:MAG: transposase, partial [Actinomycetales bacterium]|nr:transposase [Candidatus Phosphoribacter baldrii]
MDSTINRAHQHATNLRATRGSAELQESARGPPDHAIGRSRGVLSTKIHHLVDGRGLPLVVLVGPGQAGDAPMFPVLMDHLSVARGLGRPRTRPERVRADKRTRARSAPHLRDRGIVAVIPEQVRPARKPETTRLPWRPTGQLRHRGLQGPQRRQARL